MTGAPGVPPNAGLCATCRHRRLVESARGSVFVLCERSRTDPRFPRYPRLPVVACAGYDPPADVSGSSTGSGGR